MSEEGDGDNVPTERVRELEFQLARAKLAQVEAECKNQVGCLTYLQSLC